MEMFEAVRSEVFVDNIGAPGKVLIVSVRGTIYPRKSVDQVINAKRELEEAIRALIDAFEESTKLPVSNLRFAQPQTLSQPPDVLMDVRL